MKAWPMFDPVAAEVVTEPGPVQTDSTSLLGLVESILKNRPAVERLLREPQFGRVLVPRFLTIAVLGFTLYGVAMSLVFYAAGIRPELRPIQSVLAGESSRLIEFAGGSPLGGLLGLIVAYTIGLIAASGVCLPSLYFYGLLAGVRMTMLEVALQTLKAKATSAVALVGLVPIYAAAAMGAVIFGLRGELLDVVLGAGLMLPFLAGLWGTWSLYCGIVRPDGVAEPPRRRCFLRRLVVSWAACYTAVSPVMIYTIWERLT